MHRPALLVLVRHGQSERNVVRKKNRFYLDDESRKSVKGIPDHRIALTEEGRRQALLTGVAVRDAFGAFDFVFHSGYVRTVETADALLAAYTPEERAAMTVRHQSKIWLVRSSRRHSLVLRKPIVRFGGREGVISSRMASNTTRNWPSYFRASASSFRAISSFAPRMRRNWTNARMIQCSH